MSRLRKRRNTEQEAELNVTAFLNLMVVLVPFLLISAVFSQVAILELNMPEASKPAKAKDEPEEKKERVDVILRENVLQVSDGEKIQLTINADDDGLYDLEKLTVYLRAAKQRQPEKLDSTILLEPDVEYERLVNVMDALKIDVRIDEEGDAKRFELFPVVSIGDAPKIPADQSVKGKT